MEKHATPHNAALLPQIGGGIGKKGIAALAERSVDHVLEEGQVFEVAEAIAAMDEFVKSVRRDERFVEYLREELAKHHGKMVTTSGAKIELCEAGVVYDFTQSAEWRALDEQIRMLQQDKKAVEEKLKCIRSGAIVVDPETGEVFEGAQKKSTSTYRITLSK